MDFQRAPEDERQLEERLSAPPEGVAADLAAFAGDLVILGAGGKMGPGLARMARRAFDSLGRSDRVIAVSRFSSAQARAGLEEAGIEVRCLDVLQADPSELPDAALVVSLLGQKFGSSTDLESTWAVNALLAAKVVERYRGSRVAVLSTGNVYGLCVVGRGGSREEDAPQPVGEYAMSALGRERLAAYCCRRYDVPTVLLRLNYACDLRYGVMVDLADSILRDRPVDLSMGYFNTLWQGTANAWILRSLALCSIPATVLNLTGPEELSVRDVALRLGSRLGRPPRFVGQEAPTSLLSCADRACRLWGRPEVDADTLLDWVAEWSARGRPTLGKPTHFESRSGRF